MLRAGLFIFFLSLVASSPAEAFFRGRAPRRAAATVHEQTADGRRIGTSGESQVLVREGKIVGRGYRGLRILHGPSNLIVAVREPGRSRPEEHLVDAAGEPTGHLWEHGVAYLPVSRTVTGAGSYGVRVLTPAGFAHPDSEAWGRIEETASGHLFGEVYGSAAELRLATATGKGVGERWTKIWSAGGVLHASRLDVGKVKLDPGTGAVLERVLDQ